MVAAAVGKSRWATAPTASNACSACRAITVTWCRPDPFHILVPSRIFPVPACFSLASACCFILTLAMHLLSQQEPLNPDSVAFCIRSAKGHKADGYTGGQSSDKSQSQACHSNHSLGLLDLSARATSVPLAET